MSQRESRKLPRWTTSWPEWFGIFGNVSVVPAEDYDRLLASIKSNLPSGMAEMVFESAGLTPSGSAAQAGEKSGTAPTASVPVGLDNGEQQITFNEWWTRNAFDCRSSRLAAEAGWDGAMKQRVNAFLSERTDTVAVRRSLAERTEAMFRSVDPTGQLAVEWKQTLLGERPRGA